MRKQRPSRMEKNKKIHFKYLMRVFLTASLIGVSTKAYADISSGIIGGLTSDSASYAALISSSGTVTPVSGLPENIVTPRQGKGAIFNPYYGSRLAAFHLEPPIHENRLFFSVVPCMEKDLADLKKRVLFVYPKPS